MNEFITFIAKKIVDFPDEVNVKEVEGEKTIIYELMVNKSDLGKVIGRRGRIISSIRTLLKAASAKAEKKVVLEVLD